MIQLQTFCHNTLYTCNLASQTDTRQTTYYDDSRTLHCNGRLKNPLILSVEQTARTSQTTQHIVDRCSAMTDRKLKNKCIMHRRWKAMQYQQKTPPEPQFIGHQETVYFLQLLLQGVLKTAENRGKIDKNNQVVIKCWWNFIYRLPLNGRSR